MKRSRYILAGALAGWLLTAVFAFSQTVPVTDNLWRLVAQEDTDHDQKITVHDHTSPFEIRDEKGATMRAITNEYQLSVLMQELKQADERHTENIAMNEL